MPYRTRLSFLEPLFFCVLFLLIAYRISQTPDGMSDWGDTHFINYLLEHWYQSFIQFRNPLLTSFFWPHKSALGMSTSMALFSPYYAVFRIFYDQLVSYNLTVLAVAYTGVVSLYWAVKRLLDSRPIAILFAALYIASPVYWEQTGFVWSQNLHAHFIPVLFLLIVLGLQSKKGLKRTLLFVLLGAGTAFILFSESYTGIFLHIFLLLFFVFFERLSTLAIGQTLFSKKEPHYFAGFNGRVYLKDALFTLLGWVPSFGLFVWVYAPNANRGMALFTKTGYRPFTHVIESHQPLITFFILTLILVMVSYVRGKKPSQPYVTWQIMLPFAAFLAIATFIWFMTDVIINPWRGLVAFLPPLQSVRDISRINFSIPPLTLISLALLFSTTGVGATTAVSTSETPSAQWSIRPELILLFVLGSLMVYQSVNVSLQKTPIPWNRKAAKFDHYHQPSEEISAAIQAHCDAFGVFYQDDVSKEHMLQQYGHEQMFTAIGAMFISAETNVPTFNGYSAFGPDKWALAAPSIDEYLGLMTYWLSENDIVAGETRICLYDLYTHRLINYADLTVLVEGSQP